MKRVKHLFSFLLGVAVFLLVAAQTSNYMEQNGARWVIGGSIDIASGGEIDIESGGALKIAGTAITTSAAEINYLDGLTAGTVTASKFVLVDSNKDISAFRNLTLTNLDAGSSGTAGTIDIFPATASKGKLTFTAADSAGDTTTTIVNASQADARTYTIPDAGAAANFVLLKSAQTTAGELKRADFTEDALQIYGIPLYTIRAADMGDMGLSETAGDHYLELSANVITLVGESSLNETEASVSYFQFVIPPEYVAAGDVKIRIKHKVTGTGTLGTCTVDVEAYEQDGNGAVGSDICSTAAATTSGTWATTDFVLTATNLVAGDILNVKITSSIQETGNSNPLEATLDGIAVLLDIKG